MRRVRMFYDAFGLGTAASGALQAGANVASTMATNASNEKQTKWTNESNERMNAATNAANLQANEATNQANRAIADATNATNMQINQANIDYQKAYNEQIFEREDTAMQRAAADASAVGINPLTLNSGAASGGEASAPQATLGAQTGAPMQPNKFVAHKNQAFMAVAPQITGLANMFSDLEKMETGATQRDLLRAQVTRQENENAFFAEHGYYPSQMSDIEKLATVLANVFEGKGSAAKVLDAVGIDNDKVKSAANFVKDSISDGIQSVQSVPNGLKKVGSAVADTASSVASAESGGKLAKLREKVTSYAEELGSDFLEFQRKHNPLYKFIFGGK